MSVIAFSVMALAYSDYADFLYQEMDLQKNIHNIEGQLDSLPKESLNFIPWTLGYRSPFIKKNTTQVSIKLEFSKAYEIDSILILPSTYTEDSHELMSFGFPNRFSVENSDNAILVDYVNKDYPVPGIEPQIFKLENKVMSQGITFTTYDLAKDATWWSDDHVLSLSEIYVFSGNKNVALNSTVKVSHDNQFNFIWNKNCLVDGFSLFSPVIRKSIHPLKYTFIQSGNTCHLLYDNVNQEPLDEIRLWPVLHSLQHNYPPSSGLGFPQSIEISSSNEMNEAAQAILYESPEEVPKPGSNPLSLSFPETTDRYISIKLNDPSIDHRTKAFRISLSEIELLSGGDKVESGQWSKYPSGTYKNIKYLNDGYSNEGKILPLKSSLMALKTRFELEERLRQLNIDVAFLNGQKNERVRNLIYLGLAMMIILCLVIIILRYRSQKKWLQLRENIAADLHDEVGANLSSIANYNELLKNSLSESLNEKQGQLFDKAIDITRETSSQTKQLIKFLEQKEPRDNIENEMKNICDSTFPLLKVEIDFVDDHKLSKLKDQYHWHFLMFFKEALNNISKHAHADSCEIKFNKSSNHWLLTIIDDGIGFDSNKKSPLHLKARAQKMKMDLQIVSSIGAGTVLTLHIDKQHFT